jgi:hypothetical protein
MDVHVYFTITLANLAFGHSLWIEAIIKPWAEYSPDDDIINVPVMEEAVPLFTISFSVGASIAQVRAAVLTEVAHGLDGHGALMVCVLVIAGVVSGVIAGAVAAAAMESLVAARRGNSDDEDIY